MITLNLMGGLGNQLFQYAAAKNLAAHKNVDLHIDTSWFQAQSLRDVDLVLFNVPEVSETHKRSETLPIARSRRLSTKVKNLLSRMMPQGITNFYQEPHFHYDPQFWQLPSYQTLHNSYFCAWRYVAGADAQTTSLSKTLQDVLVPRHALSDRVKVYRDKFAKHPHACFVHVRRGDYVTDKVAQAHHGLIGMAYYRRAIEMMRRLYGDDIPLVLLSQDVDLLRQEFGDDPHAIIIDPDEKNFSEDIFIMSACRHAIMANSTLSWWGAMLGDPTGKTERTVIAPRAWFAPEVIRHDNPIDVCPPQWILM